MRYFLGVLLSLPLSLMLIGLLAAALPMPWQGWLVLQLIAAIVLWMLLALLVALPAKTWPPLIALVVEVRFGADQLAGNVAFLALWAVFLRDGVTPLDGWQEISKAVLPSALLGWGAIGGIAYLGVKAMTSGGSKDTVEEEAPAPAPALFVAPPYPPLLLLVRRNPPPLGAARAPRKCPAFVRHLISPALTAYRVLLSLVSVITP